ncbi:MAG: hypothetical protein WAL97_09785 [Halobacteriota archaeon]|jgi:hypothetical protein
MIELVVGAAWLGWLGMFGEIATILGDLLLGVVGFFAYLSLI